jgi:uncharacterized RDD family membrane protein YckC
MGALWVVEVAVVFAIWQAGFLPITEKELGEGLGLLLALGFVLFPGWPYCPLFESSKLQATPMKYLLGLRVTDLDGERLSFIRASARQLSKALSLPLFAGFLLVAFTPRKRGLHDIIAGSLVVWGRDHGGVTEEDLDSLS